MRRELRAGECLTVSFTPNVGRASFVVKRPWWRRGQVVKAEVADMDEVTVVPNRYEVLVLEVRDGVVVVDVVEA